MKAGPKASLYPFAGRTPLQVQRRRLEAKSRYRRGLFGILRTLTFAYLKGAWTACDMYAYSLENLRLGETSRTQGT